MIIRWPRREELIRLQALADYQFDYRLGQCFLPEGRVKLGIVGGGRVRYIYLDGELAAVLRPNNSLFSLHIAGGRRLHECLPYPLRRVVVSPEASPHVCRGSNVFARHVVLADAWLRAGDEVLIVDGYDKLLAVGRARLSAVEIYCFQRGEAIRVREGACGNQ